MDYSHQNTHGYPSWTPHPSVTDQHDPRIDECGNIHHRTIYTLSLSYLTHLAFLLTNMISNPTAIEYNKLKPYFGWINADTIKKTFENSTQWAVTDTRFHMR